ncbi:Rib/alpha/Esp surface antigen repeat-containing protein [Corynebacterium mycetoides]|uniref:Rib/alpha/Esp surface antigen repeat-containing protein n=1 Tax=Corynebacterium mycetoides TaxID=38302 RepID=A0A1G9NEV9_9CORY|nr:Rib/alpha/Esp surface antigen repeat-containing protein [Corynebacterium mycetoides]
MRGVDGGDVVTGAPAVTAEGVDFPSGTTFAGVGLPDGVTVDPATGAVTVDPAVLAPGEHAVTIEVTYPDGSTDRVETTVVVDDAPVADPSDADTHTPVVPPVRGVDGGDVVTGAPAVTAEGVDFPSGTTFAGVGLPDGVTVDPATGAVTVDPAVLAPGEHAVTIEVTYPDGTSETVTTTVTVDPTGTTPPVTPPGSGDSSDGSSGSADTRCVAVGSSVGIPVLLLVPVALATTVNIPGLTPLVDDISTRIGELNTELQKSVGIYNPQISQAVRDFNARIGEHNTELQKSVGIYNPQISQAVRDFNARIGEHNTELQKSVGIYNPQISQAVRDFNAQLDSIKGAREALGVAGIIAAALLLTSALDAACGPGEGASSSTASSEGSSGS